MELSWQNKKLEQEANWLQMRNMENIAIVNIANPGSIPGPMRGNPPTWQGEMKMAIVAQDVKPLPPGKHVGVISNVEETTNDFGSGKPKLVVEIEFQSNEAKSMPVSMVYAAKLLRGYSGLSKFIDQIGAKHPEPGQPWNHHDLEGTEVEFETINNERGFAKIVKESVRPVRRK